MQLHVLVGGDDLKVDGAGNTQPLVLQQLQGRGVNELMGPPAGQQPALAPDEGLAHVELVALVLEVAVAIEGVATLVVEQTDLG